MTDETQSLCPVCLHRIPAVRVIRGDNVYLKKECPAHGEFETIIWKGKPDFNRWRRPKIPTMPPVIGKEKHRGCPFDCGLCPDHRQRTCTVVVEITHRCDLKCPVCYADSPSAKSDELSLKEIARWLKLIRHASGDANIQLSGGEPTVRDDLPEIVSLCKDAGFSFIQLNTNGIRLGVEPEFTEKLKIAGLSSVFLQFDGIDDSIYLKIRGRPLMKEKRNAIAACQSNDIGVVLVPTLISGINTEQVGGILKTAMSYSPIVRGVHFQPISFFGRYPANTKRVTLPELMQLIEIQTHGLFTATRFKPPGCENALCSFHGNYVLKSNGLAIPLSKKDCCSSHETAESGAERAVSFVARQWKAPRSSENTANTHSCCSNSGGIMTLDEFIERARTHTFSVSAMAFMDAWTIDLERVKDCCIHMAAPDGRLIPFCLYNLTSQTHESLYRYGKIAPNPA